MIAAAVWSVYKQRHAFTSALRDIGPWLMLGSFGCGLVGVGATFPLWEEVLSGLGVPFPRAFGARIFFVTQLGKYLPGSVWPTVMQMEAGRSLGATRRTMLAANIITIALNCAVGLVVGAALLPFYDATTVHRYWWTLFAVPVLLAVLHPRALPSVLDRALALLHRPPLGLQLDVRSELRAGGWSLVSWGALGSHLGVIALGVPHSKSTVFLLALGAMAFAVPVGVLFIPAPAGAGIRDIILLLVLRTAMSSGNALAVVVASRVILIMCDIALAAIAGLAAVLAGRRAGTARLG